MGPGSRPLLQARRRRHGPQPGPAHGHRDLHRRDGLVLHPDAREGVLPQPARAGDRRVRRVPLAGHVLLLLLLRAGRDPHVPADRDLGQHDGHRGSQLRHDEARAPAQHRRGPRAGRADRGLHRGRHLRHGAARAARVRHQPADGLVPGDLPRLRDARADVAAALVEPGRSRRRAGRRLDAPRRRAHEARRVQHHPVLLRVLPRGDRRLHAVRRHPLLHEHHLRRARGGVPEGPEAHDRLLVLEPHGLRAPGHGVADARRPRGRRVPHVRPRPDDGPRSSRWSASSTTRRTRAWRASWAA